MLLSSDSEYIKARRKEKRNELIEERCNNFVKKARTQPSFADINKNISEKDMSKKISEREFILAVHEELTLNQMNNDYTNFLNTMAKTNKAKPEHFEELFLKNKKRFESKDFTNFLHNYHGVLKSNKEMYKRYKDINAEELHEKRIDLLRQYNVLCKRMDAITQRYSSLDKRAREN